MRVVPDFTSISWDSIAHSGRSGSANVKDTVNVLSSATPLMSRSMSSPSTRANASPSSTARFPPAGSERLSDHLHSRTTGHVLVPVGIRTPRQNGRGGVRDGKRWYRSWYRMTGWLVARAGFGAAAVTEE